MRRAGRVNWIVIAVVVGFVFIGVLLFAGKSSPTQAANEFLTALAKGDVNKLCDLSYYPKGSKDDLRKQWDFAVHDAGKNFTFTWRVKDEKQSNDTNASVQLGWIKDARKPGAYEDGTELPMVKENGKWLVDVAAIDRELFPGLPR